MKRTGPPKRSLDKLRAWQRRSKKLDRSGKPLKRRSGIAPVGRRKAREKKQKLVDGPLCERARSLPCCVCGKPGPSVPHHVSGGTLRRDYLPDGTPNVTPLCEKHHTGDEGVHTLGRDTFAARFGVNLEGIAKEIGDGD